MLIRSADKTKIVNLDVTGVLEISKCRETEKRAIYVGNRYVGEYQSERRAIEVLDEICNVYISLNDKDRKTGFSYVKNGVYHMPEE